MCWIVELLTKSLGGWKKTRLSLSPVLSTHSGLTQTQIVQPTLMFTL